MTCRCEGWRARGSTWSKTCWPRTSKGEDYWGKRMEVSIQREYPASNPVYPAARPQYHYALAVYNKGGSRAITSIGGTPVRSLAAAKKKVAELLASECRFRGFSGVRRSSR